jgi:hypothetical protein
MADEGIRHPFFEGIHRWGLQETAALLQIADLADRLNLVRLRQGSLEVLEIIDRDVSRALVSRALRKAEETT